MVSSVSRYAWRRRDRAPRFSGSGSAELAREGRAVRLFERTTGLQRRASDLPLREIEAG